ncbi:acyltransferase [Glaciimonas sp. CA11.2]|uniref:acyltransferase family protein n=1 Tax=Glaciimonas sp. CA11.2 TaxID=3048601 RepID=UPI002AB40A2D|nr:acyltransferase [Glaciimonas sp. CA11.2]MDY7547887.1 acyltransferase [Glaciimonas sp. CA11.2]
MAINEQNVRDENLQILRFVAAALVLVTHITFYIHDRINLGSGVWHGGESGVPIFFVISGFVMYLSGQKLSKNADGAKRFLRRRIARVFPLYWLITTLKVTIALIIPALILHNRPDLLSVIGSYVLFPMLNAVGEVRPIHGVAWTLLHEMLFYYVFALSLFLRQPTFVFTSLIIVGMSVIGLFVRAESALAQVCFNTINLMFVSGMALALGYSKGFRLPKGLALTLLGLGLAILLIPYVRDLRHYFVGDFHVEGVMIVAALLSIKMSIFPNFKKLLVQLGDSSYSLYMIHPILAPAICVILLKFYIQSAYLILPIAFVSCVCIAHFVYRYIETPLNTRMRNFLEKIFTSDTPIHIANKKLP